MWLKIRHPNNQYEGMHAQDGYGEVGVEQMQFLKGAWDFSTKR